MKKNIEKAHLGIYSLVGSLIYHLLTHNLAISMLEAFSSTIQNKEFLHFQLASLYSEIYQWDKTILHQKILIEIAPNNLSYSWALGVMYFGIGRYKDVLFELKHLSENVDLSESERASCFAVLGIINVMLENPQEAERLLSLSKSLTPWNLDSYKGLIDLYQLTGREKLIPSLLQDYIDKYNHVYPPFVWMAQYYQFLEQNLPPC